MAEAQKLTPSTHVITKQLKITDIALTPQVVTDWTITPDAGTTLAEVLDPQYLTHVAIRMTPGSIVRVMPKDNTYYAELYVRAVGSKSVLLHKLVHISFDGVSEIKDDDDYEVSFGGPMEKYRVVRKSDKSIMKTHLLNREEGNQWIAEHKKSFAK